MATYIVRQAFLAFTVGQVVYSDADATGKPAGSVVTDAQVAGHTASLVTVSSSGGGSSTGTGTSTGGTSTTGTGTSTGGTSTTGTGTGTGGSTAPAATYVTSFVRNSDGSTTFFSNDGTMLTVPASAPLTTAQAATLASVGSIVNSTGQVTAPVVGDVSNATVGGVLESVIGSMVATHTAHLLSLDTGLTSIQKAATDAATLASTAGTAATGAKTEADSISVTVTAHDLLLGTHTAQLGTLASGVTSAGSLAAAASTLAGSALGTPSIVNGALSFKTAAGSAGPTVTLPPGATPIISIGGVSTGTTAAASITGSAATPVLNLVIPPGPTGALGSAGAAGSAGTAGQGFNFRGPWAVSTAYAAYDVLTYQGGTYHVLTAFTSGATFSNTNLALFAAPGAAGSAGAPGATGSAGAAGPGGQGFNFRGAWAASTVYAAYDVLTNAGSTYHVLTGFTSGTTFSTTNLALVAAVGAAGSAGAPGMSGAAGQAGTAGPQGPAGTLGTGSVGGNTAAPFAGGPDRPLSAVLGDRVSMTSYGSTQTNNRVSDPVSSGGLGITTRAALAAYKNSAGQTPYAFMATQPTPNATSTGTDEYEFFVPSAVAVSTTSTQTVTLATAYTTTGALFQSAIDGHWYIPIGVDAGHTFVPDMAVVHPSLAAGTVILATHQTTIMVSNQAAGTTMASGSSVTIGADMTKVKVGQQIWSTQGVVPSTTIASISGNVVTLSALLVSAADAYGRTTNGLFKLQLCRVFTPTPEASVCGAITMDTLSLMAAYYNAPVGQHGGLVQLHPGDYVTSLPMYLWGRNVSIVGADNNTTFIRSVVGALDILFIAPTPFVRCSYRGFSFDPYNGLSRSDLHVYGCGYDVPTPNSTANQGDFECVQGLTSSGIGAKQHIRLRHVSGVFAKDCTHQGYGYAAADSCTFSLGGCVAFYATNCGSINCESAFLAEGYNEHLLVVDSASQQSGYRYKGDKGSTLSGVALLIFEMRGGDADNYFANDLVALALGVVIGPGTVQFTNSTTGTTAVPANAGEMLRGCSYGWVGGLTGGAVGGVNADCVQAGPAQLDGGTQNTQFITFESINANSYKTALRLLPGTSNNFVSNKVILMNGGASAYGYDTVNSVINQGTANYVEPWAASR